jgi:hypothetical protein
MNTPNRPDDDFERELAALSNDYRAAAEPHAGPPASMDDAIRAAARRAVQSKPRDARWGFLPAWARPLTAAALVVLTVSVMYVAVDNDPGLNPTTPTAPLASRDASSARMAEFALSPNEIPPAPSPTAMRDASPAAPIRLDPAASDQPRVAARAKVAPQSNEVDRSSKPEAVASAGPVAQPALARPAPQSPAAPQAPVPVLLPPPPAAAPAPTVPATPSAAPLSGDVVVTAPPGLDAPVATDAARAEKSAIPAPPITAEKKERTHIALAKRADTGVASAPPVAAAAPSASRARESASPASAAQSVLSIAAAPLAEKRTQPAGESHNETNVDATFKRLREHIAAMRWREFDDELAALEKATPGLLLPPDIKDAKDNKFRRK